MKQTDAVLAAWLETAVDTGGPYDPAALFLGLATAMTDNAGATAIADITPATGALATRKAVASWGAAYKMADGRWVVDGPLLTFFPASAAEAQTITHWYLASALTAGTLKAWESLDPAVTLLDQNRHLSVIPRITIDPEGRFSAEVVFNG